MISSKHIIIANLLIKLRIWLIITIPIVMVTTALIEITKSEEDSWNYNVIWQSTLVCEECLFFSTKERTSLNLAIYEPTCTALYFMNFYHSD